MIQVALAGGEPIGFHAQLLQNGNEEITERSPVTASALKPMMFAGFKSAPRKQDR